MLLHYFFQQITWWVFLLEFMYSMILVLWTLTCYLQFQISQQRPYHSYGSVESSFSRNYRPGSSYQSSNYGTASTTNWGANYRSRFASDKGGRQERDRESFFVSNDAHGTSSDRNRGPRASKPKSKSPAEDSSISATSKNVASVSAVHRGLYNQPDFVTDYENAKFFVIKSFSEDNVHKSIKYSVWASTPLGNKKLEIAYGEAKEMKGQCPIFLLFSVHSLHSEAHMFFSY